MFWGIALPRCFYLFSIYFVRLSTGVPSGTKVVLHLKADCRRFAKDSDIKRIVAKHSISIGFPIQVNGATQTAVGAIWLRNRNDVSEQEYVDFYKQTANAYEKPFDTLHFATDVPLSLNALLYFPKRHTEKFGMGKEKPSVNLLSRKVTIQAGSPHLLPDWLRFMKGVVDSADIPLNISRESMQNSALIRRINNVITQRILRHLSDMAKQEPARYNEFYEEFGQFLKEGVCSDDQNRTKIASLLRFSSSSFDHLTSLDEYVSRMPADQKHIYYFFNPSRELALSSPYYESFKERGTEVLFLYREVDDFVMQNLRRHADRPFMSIESAHLENKKDTAHDDKTDESNSAENVIKEGMPAYMQSVLGKRVSSVSVSKRLVSSPAILIDHENAAVRRMMKMVEGGKTMVDSLGKQKMEINLSHSIIKGIFAMRDSNPELASQLVEQVFDNALVAAGLMDDPRLMLTRINRLMESCLASSTAIPQTEQTTVSTPEAESTIETAKSASQ
uniref:TNF receptor-associated protein 1 n=1 Tax=Spongospora subterranea TaxID=70186 RepID=A0A0H5R2H7_9EUKA|eukprot:CRZ02084.1 hypothetical protein [Spongospora subterranea]